MVDMDFEVLPGPGLAEVARTVMARACAAVVNCAGPSNFCVATVPLQVSVTGQPILLARHGSELARQLAAGPALVTVTVPADAPFSALRLTGTTGPGAGAERPGQGLDLDPEPRELAAYPVTLRALEFTGATPAEVGVTQYQAAAPDPFRFEAPAVLHHLEHWHMAELVNCVRAHGMAAAECVVPSGLDRFGLELLVLTADGLAPVRLAFPDGPVTEIDQIPASIRAVLTCRCHGGPADHRA
jgi:hypothetical protein